MKKFRRVVFFKGYFQEFYTTLPIKVQNKFVWTFELIEDIERVPAKYLKHVSDGMYEIRVQSGSNIYRAFCFFDDDKLVVTINGFTKKSQKTPRKEIVRANQIRKEYEEEK
jgi:phage-related protein